MLLVVLSSKQGLRGLSPESLAPSQYARLPDWGSVGLVGFRFAHSYAASLGHASLIFFGVFVLVLVQTTVFGFKPPCSAAGVWAARGGSSSHQQRAASSSEAASSKPSSRTAGAASSSREQPNDQQPNTVVSSRVFLSDRLDRTAGARFRLTGPV